MISLLSQSIRAESGLLLEISFALHKFPVFRFFLVIRITKLTPVSGAIVLAGLTNRIGIHIFSLCRK